MKNSVKVFALLLMLFGLTSMSQAQSTQKMGYIDFNILLAGMPGIDSVKIKLQNYQQVLSDQMDAMKAEFENKYLDYQSQSATLSDLIRQTKEKELTDLQGRIEAFQSTAQQDLQAKQAELLQPFIEKAKTAVKEVATEHKYTFVFNSIEDVVLYADPADDLMPLVKKKLGMQ